MTARSQSAIASALIACLALAMPACAQVSHNAGTAPAEVQSPQVSGLAPPMAGQQGYVLAAEDQVQITLYGEPPTVVQTRIKSDGTIVLPQLGTVRVTGYTADTLGDKLEADLKRGGFYTDPQVNVEITGYASKIVTVLGHVASPGIYPLDRPQTVAMMVARAGGVRNDGANAVILSHKGDAEGQRVPLANLLDQQGAHRTLQPGDMLVVPPAEQVYVYGEVKSPGAMALRSGMTFRQALASAGGPTLAGTASGFTVQRDGKRLKLQLDDLIEPEDVIFIRERFF